MDEAALLQGVREDLPKGATELEVAMTVGKDRLAEAAARQVIQEGQPKVVGLPVPDGKVEEDLPGGLRDPVGAEDPSFSRLPWWRGSKMGSRKRQTNGRAARSRPRQTVK